MEKTNYYNLFENEIKKVSALPEKPSLLLHSCCAPCSSSVIELLLECFDVTVYYYNPNIYPSDEYYKRKEEQEKFCREYFKDANVKVVSEDYNEEDFLKIAKDKENLSEGGARCTLCYHLRLEKTAGYAAKNGYDYFASTLSVSPLKCADRLNKIGEELSKEYGVKYLYNDFKKKNGYRRSCELSVEYDLYRQEQTEILEELLADGSYADYRYRMVNSAARRVATNAVAPARIEERRNCLLDWFFITIPHLHLNE